MPPSLPEQLERSIAVPDAPVLSVNAKEAAILTQEGEVKILPHAQAQMIVHRRPAMVCHAPYTRARLGVQDLAAFDVLELFAFVHPAKFCVPTPAGLAKFLGLQPPAALEDMPGVILEAAQALLHDLQKEPRGSNKCDPADMAQAMGLAGKGWPWSPFVCAALGRAYDNAMPVITRTAMAAWKHLPEWSESAPPPPPSHYPVTPDESRERLRQMLSAGHAEAREEQMLYAAKIASAFAPPSGQEGTAEPALVLAEAGTGVGKTLGYLAPASVWAEKNSGTVWISTYTKNLQRQIDQELTRLYPEPETKARKVTIRKGRENYLCLLNLEDHVNGAALAKHVDQAIGAGLMARWAGASRDGDLTGGDFPGWLSGLIGVKHSLMLADRRGECIYSACDHYHKCFVERAVRKARHADIVVANHALVMTQTAMAGPDADLPRRYVFDEGHHIFDAADGAFAGHLTARETADLRRWIRGAEGGRGRARGLRRRVEDLIADDAGAIEQLQAVMHESGSLPGQGWSKRLKDREPQGAAERFLIGVYDQVSARADGRGGPYSLETDTFPLSDGLVEIANILKVRLKALKDPMIALAKRLRQRLSDHADTLDSDTRRRLESVAAALERRGLGIEAWIEMLATLTRTMNGFSEKSPYIDWMEIERIDGHSQDVGLYRHYIDPTRPFAQALKPHAHGVAITSATLRDASGDEARDWGAARERTGSDFLSSSPEMFGVLSPFDYAARTRIFIVNDIRRDDPGQIADAYRVLFEAAGGGALGLFTSIQRLRAVHRQIAERLEHAGLPLYAQHVDGMDTGTLVDIFRDEIHASLLGTDAVRDGVDVPGESLRLLVYDRVPWPRPTILHRARRDAFGGRDYDDRLTRLKLRQAYGRLIRRASDKGVFVMLDSMLPSRLLSAFPEGVEISRTGLAETAHEVKAFLDKAL